MQIIIKETKSCKKCGAKFTMTDRDAAFYEKMQMPPPTLCPSCRQQRRMAWRNEWKLYQRQSSLSGERIISYISPDKPNPVYSLKEWFSDSWNGCKYGKDFDFNRPFFEQFKELLNETPHIPLLIGDCENCEYTNYSLSNKNCYLISAADYSEDSYYCSYIMQSRNCVDCFFVNDSELCYECVDSEKCYQVFFSQNCKNCQTSMYCENCQGCIDCIGCVNLRNSKYMIFNEKFSKAEYEKKRTQLLKSTDIIQEQFRQLKASSPQKAVEQINCQDCIGSNLINSKNCVFCFDLVDCQDCTYVTYGIKTRDSMDINGAPDDELLYECVASPQCYNTRFCSACWVNSSNLTYCHLCRASNDCFGCVSLYRNSYCILNRQYTKQEYETLVPKIIDHMKSTNEWGEFFPIIVSPFAYNETIAQDYFTLTKEEAQRQNFPWKESDEKKYVPSTLEAPRNIKEIPDSIINEILACQECGKNYKIIPQELKFYREMSLEIPLKCPDCRRLKRLKQRRPAALLKTACAKCGHEIFASVPKDCVRPIYCEKCYGELVY